MMKYKLLYVERLLAVYENKSNENLQEINLDHLSLDILTNIVQPKDYDPLLYDGYVLDEHQLKKLNENLENMILPNFALYFYVLECSGIYE